MNFTRTDPPAPEPTYTVELTRDEANGLYAELARCQRYHKYGGAMAALFAALLDAREAPSPKLETVLIDSSSELARVYRVTLVDGDPVSCTCPDYEHRGGAYRRLGRPPASPGGWWCKHMRATATS